MILSIALIVGTILASLVNPRWGFIGLVAGVLYRPQDRFPELATLPTFQMMMLGLLVGMALHSNTLVKPDARQDKFILWLFLLSLVGLLIQASSELIQQTNEFLAAILMYVFATRLIRDKRDLLNLLFWLSVVTTLLGLEALTSYLTDTQSPFSELESGRLQGLGLYANPNEFGKLMCTAIPFFAIFVFSRGNFVLKLIALAGIGVMVAVVGLTQSRTCYVVLALIAMTPFLVSSRSGAVKRLIVAGIIGAGSLYVISVLPGPLQERAQSIMAFSSDESFLGRLRSWEQGIQMVTWYPLYGIGKGQWEAYHGLAPHNSYIQVMAETGLPGLFLFLAIVWTCWQQVVAYCRLPRAGADPGMATLSRWVTASYLGYLFYIFLGNQGYSPWTYFYFGICVAVGHIAKQHAVETDDAEPAAAPPRRAPPIGGLPAARFPGRRP